MRTTSTKNELWRDPPWWLRDIVIAFTLALVITGIQVIADDRREEQSTRLENLRFVRERASTDPELARPFSSMDLEGQNLNGLSLPKAVFTEAKLSHGHLVRANLVRANLRHADLRYADLEYADLREADFAEADVTGATFRYSDLRGATLSTDLTQADIEQANMSDANLRGADLTGVDLSVICLSDGRPKLPRGVTLPNKDSWVCMAPAVLEDDFEIGGLPPSPR